MKWLFTIFLITLLSCTGESKKEIRQRLEQRLKNLREHRSSLIESVESWEQKKRMALMRKDSFAYKNLTDWTSVYDGYRKKYDSLEGVIDDLITEISLYR